MSHTRSHCPRASPGRSSAFSRIRTVDLSGVGSAGCVMPHAAAMRFTIAVASGRAAAASLYTSISSSLSCLHSAPPSPTRSLSRSSLSSLRIVLIPSASVDLISSMTES